LAFGREFTRAIEAKQVAQQESERAKFVVSKAEQLKLAAIIRAEGESEAAELISQALAVNGTGLIEVRRIDVRLPDLAAVGGNVVPWWLFVHATLTRVLLVSFSVFFFFPFFPQAARDIAHTLARARNVTYLPSSNMLLNMGVGK